MFGSKKKIRKSSSDKKKPYLNLVPIVKALVEAGNYTKQKDYFIETPGGWICCLRDPIDFVIINKKFDLPDNVEIYELDDLISDKVSWVEIMGGGGDKA